MEGDKRAACQQKTVKLTKAEQQTINIILDVFDVFDVFMRMSSLYCQVNEYVINRDQQRYFYLRK